MIRRILNRLSYAHTWHRVGRSMQHVSGAKQLKLKHDSVVVFCLVKDAEFFLADYIEHHLALGATHVVLVDNGSSDETLSIAKEYQRVSAVRSLLPVKRYECVIRRFAAKRFAWNHWCLFVDSDEQFDYPFSDQVQLEHLAAYLSNNGYSAVVTQMLDMFPEEPSNIGNTGVHQHNNYSLSDINALDYHAQDSPLSWFLRSNETSNPRIRFLYGGIRKRWFDVNCCLTKHSMVHFSGRAIPVAHPHCATNVRCADFSAMVRHYKFAGDFQGRIRGQVEQKVWDHGEDQAYLQHANGHLFENLCKPLEAEIFDRASRLVDLGFLVVSDCFRKYAQDQRIELSTRGKSTN